MHIADAFAPVWKSRHEQDSDNLMVIDSGKMRQVPAHEIIGMLATLARPLRLANQ